MLEKKYKYLIAMIFLSPLVFFFIYSFFIPSHLCQLSYDFKKSNYKAVLVDKYIDQKNHRTKTIVFKIDSEEGRLILPRDTSSFFEYIRIGDTLLKKESHSFIEVCRGGLMKKFNIYFDCDE